MCSIVLFAINNENDEHLIGVLRDFLFWCRRERKRVYFELGTRFFMCCLKCFVAHINPINKRENSILSPRILVMFFRIFVCFAIILSTFNEPKKGINIFVVLTFVLSSNSNHFNFLTLNSFFSLGIYLIHTR